MKPIFYLVLLLISISCNDINIEIDMPTHSPKVVVDGIYKAGETIKIHVGESSGIFENLKPPIADATVKLYKNETLLETLVYNAADEYYESENITEIDTSYNIVVSAPSLDNVSAVSHTPKLPVLAGWEYGGYENDPEMNEWKNHFLKINIQDDVNTSNYYEAIVVITNVEGDVEGWGEWDGDGVIERGVSNQQEPVFNREASPPNIFSDALFNGVTYGLECTFCVPAVVTSFDLSIKLRGVTKDYYDYQKKLLQHLNAQEEGNILYIEPVQLFSNIQGGYGIFTGYSEIEEVVIEN